MYYVYVLENEQGKHYVGFSEKRPETRAAEHNQAKSKWTRHRGPWSLVHSEAYPTKREAFLREKKIKSYKGGRAFKKLIDLRRDAGAVERARLESA